MACVSRARGTITWARRPGRRGLIGDRHPVNVPADLPPFDPEFLR
jgi:hypothetical protein